MSTVYEYRYEGWEDWAECKFKAWDMEEVAREAAELYFDNCDERDANNFSQIVEVRLIGSPDKIETFKVTAGYSVVFYARTLKEETK